MPSACAVQVKIETWPSSLPTPYNGVHRSHALTPDWCHPPCCLCRTEGLLLLVYNMLKSPQKPKYHG